MLIDTKFNRCILCLKSIPLSKEHIFPESIGGRFQARILCTSCNNNRGSNLFATIKKDMGYLEGLKYLKNELPDLYKSTEFKYASRASDGNIVYSRTKNGIHKVQTKKSLDGSIITNKKDACIIIHGLLSSKGYCVSGINDCVQKYKQLAINSEIRIGKELIVKTKLGPSLVPKPEDDETCKLAVTLIGYEFLALLLRDDIFDSRLDYLRDFIKTGIQTNKINFAIFGNVISNYRSRHEILFNQSNEQLIITVKFLGASIYKITFTEFIWKIPDIIFIEDIKQKKSFIASIEDAKKGIVDEI